MTCSSSSTLPLFTDIGTLASTPTSGLSVLTVYAEDNLKQVTFASIPSESTRNNACVRVDSITEAVQKYLLS